MSYDHKPAKLDPSTLFLITPCGKYLSKYNNRQSDFVHILLPVQGEAVTQKSQYKLEHLQSCPPPSPAHPFVQALTHISLCDETLQHTEVTGKYPYN